MRESASTPTTSTWHPSGSLLLIATAQSNISEEQLATMLGVSRVSLRKRLLGNSWRSYLPLAAYVWGSE